MNRQERFYEQLLKNEVQNIEKGAYQEYRHRECHKPKITLLDTFLATVSLKESILEIGCGSCHVLTYFKDKCNSSRACGIDISTRAISFAQEHHRDFIFLVHNIDAKDLPFKDNELEIVLLYGIVEHVSRIDSGCKTCCVKCPTRTYLAGICKNYIREKDVH